MIERLANAIYWVGSGVAGLLLVSGIWVAFAKSDRPDALSAGIAVGLLGVLVYGGGWGMRFILTGRR